MPRSVSVVLRSPGELAVEEIEVPVVPGPAIAVELRACGICGSDVRYFQGENPWALHTLGRNVPSPPNMVLGHEVSGVTVDGGSRVAILAYRACGTCRYCASGRENLCADMEHFGHSAGWGKMAYYPGGMSRQFTIWKDFAYSLPDSISFEEATFLDGLAVAIHAVRQGSVGAGTRVGVIGLGPIGMLAAQVARAWGAALVAGCDTAELPVNLARRVGLTDVRPDGTEGLASLLRERNESGFDTIIDTVGSERSMLQALELLDGSGTLVLVAVHDAAVPFRASALSTERRIVTSANNRYSEFPEAIELLGSGQVRVRELITHRFPLAQAAEAFDVMLRKNEVGAYKVIITP